MIMITIPSHISNSIPPPLPLILLPEPPPYQRAIYQQARYMTVGDSVSVQDGTRLWRQLEAVSRCISRRCVNCIKIHSKFCFTITQAHHNTRGHIRKTWPTDPMISVAFFVLLYSEHWLLFCYMSMTIQYIRNNFTIRFQTSHWVKNVIPT